MLIFINNQIFIVKQNNMKNNQIFITKQNRGDRGNVKFL